MTRKSPAGTTAQFKERLIQQALERRLLKTETPDASPDPPRQEFRGGADIPEKYYRFHLHPGYQQLRIIN
ncbi:MAG: aminotransferase class I/II-fold pyridoxal phosphate-dependent enzyme, partial [Burkholderiales bacterium]